MSVEPLADRVDPQPVTRSDVLLHGRVWDVVRDEVDLGDAGRHVREYVRHPGAVAVLVLDEQGRTCLIQQYRHPIRTRDWEIPAGLLDVPGEPAWEAAARELLEEADLLVGRLDVLVDLRPSPGGLDEAIRVFLARGCTPVPEADRHAREAEEHGMPRVWVPLDDVVEAALEGRLQNGILVAAVLAAQVARLRDWDTLRPHDAAWPQRPDAPEGDAS
ncbi:ADP-ribose pyrophosphatase [Knoellia sinensis KCTC 19936]|uniref:ADP-ribose pyrophosphatase n=1 Tax=Knoellia sinensis KCTC 19936 TaxID=1385520 RepID=A0A0A0J8V6_9MICO|nr:NUDIX hydrolase [Knoellia sinensis]KGN32467.1 ADP-ribose pyrophosphatase [Knoellia sinensis KCTC 19936]